MACVDWNQEDYQVPTGTIVLPQGDYLVKIIKEEIKDTSTGQGRGLNFSLEVVDGPKRNAKVYLWLNLWHNSQQAKEIARGELRGITAACNKTKIKDTAELHGIPFVMTAKCKGTGGDMKNQFSNFRRKGSAAAGQVMPQNPDAAAPAEQPASNQAAPW